MLAFFIVIITLIKPVDFSPLENRDYYKQSMNSLLDIDTYVVSDSVSNLSVGCGRSTILDRKKEAYVITGHRKRGETSLVHDSLEVKVITIDSSFIFIAYDWSLEDK